MLAIKLQRVGKKHQPSYRFVVAEKRSKMAGPPVEDLGSYNPFTKTSNLKKDRVSHWIKMGAQPTVTVHNLLVGQGVVTTPKRVVKMKKVVVSETVVPKETASAVAAAAPAEVKVPAATAETTESKAEIAGESATEEAPSP